jgi:hypothetical protein
LDHRPILDQVVVDEEVAGGATGAHDFARVGASLYFATEPNAYATVRNLLFNQGRPVGDTESWTR